MFHKKIKTKHLMGFAIEKAEKGNRVKVLVKESLTSNEYRFSVYVNQISSLFLLKAGFNSNFVVKCLIILHKNDTADIYVNDFLEMLRVKVNRGIKKGEKVFQKDVSDIKEIKFPDIKILKDDVVIYFAKIDWRYCLYFDFTRNISQKIIQKDIGELIKKLHPQIPSNRLLTNNGHFVDENRETACQDKIFVEGNTDKKYLEKFKKFFVSSLNFDIIDIQDKNSSGGSKKLLNHFYTLFKSGHSGYKCFFIFDCDAEDDFKKCEEVKTYWLMSFCWDHNEKNKIVENGIENLFEEKLFRRGKHRKKRFFPSVIKDYGDKKVNVGKRKLVKKEFAKFICDERNNREDFKNFESLTKFIQENKRNKL